MVSNKIRALLALTGKRNIDLAVLYGISKQSMNNKLANNRFSADDLIRIAEFTGCRVGFFFPDGQNIFLEPEDVRQKEADRSSDEEETQ